MAAKQKYVCVARDESVYSMSCLFCAFSLSSSSFVLFFVLSFFLSLFLSGARVPPP
jgi:hypothetical protein